MIKMLLYLSFGLYAFAKSELPTPLKVDLQRYVGKWYSVSALPRFYTRNCVSQTAEYKIIDTQTISVTNTCYKKNGKITDIKGKANVIDQKTNARLEVTFDSFFTKLFRVKGEYVIIKLSENYDTVMVGTTDRKALWVMSRTPTISPDVLKDYKNFAKEIGFEVQKLVDTI